MVKLGSKATRQPGPASTSVPTSSLPERSKQPRDQLRFIDTDLDLSPPRAWFRLPRRGFPAALRRLERELSGERAPPTGRESGSGQRTRHRWLLRAIVVPTLAVFAISVALVGVAYWQAFRAYREVSPTFGVLQAFRADIHRGSLPPDGVLSDAQGRADRASASFRQGQFILSFAASIPVLNRPIKAVRYGIEAAQAETEAAILTAQIVMETTGQTSSQARPKWSSTSRSPVLSPKGIRVGVLTRVAEDLARVRSNLVAGDRALSEIPSIPFLSSMDATKEEALGLSTQALRDSARASTALRVLIGLLAPRGSALYAVMVEGGSSAGSGPIACSLLTVSDGTLSLSASCPRIRMGTAVNGDSAGGLAAFSLRLSRVWEKHLDQPLAGVLSFDLEGLAGVLRAEPPIRVASYPYPIYAQNLPDLFSRAERGDLHVSDVEAFEEDVAHAAFDLLRRPTAALATVRALGDALATDHLRIWTVDQGLEGLITQMGWS